MHMRKNINNLLFVRLLETESVLPRYLVDL